MAESCQQNIVPWRVGCPPGWTVDAKRWEEPKKHQRVWPVPVTTERGDIGKPRGTPASVFRLSLALCGIPSSRLGPRGSRVSRNQFLFNSECFTREKRVMLVNVFIFLFMDFVESAAKRGVTTVEYLKEQENEVIHFDGLVCPPESHRLQIFAYKCNTHEDCKGFGEMCCRERGWKICRQGVLRRRKEPKHAPFLPGIQRICPTKEAVIEILPIQNCTRDRDCTPRICCPEGRFSYCRTAVPKVDSRFYPRIMKSFKAVMAYLQCTSPPPPLLDFFPKPCKNSLDCFPNLCCQERGRKVCRPPKRSLLTHLASLT